MKKTKEVQAIAKAINFNIVAIFLIMLMLTVWIFTVTFANANSGPNVILEFDKTEAEVGEIVRATVKVNNIKNFAGYQVNISYNPDVVEVVNPYTGIDSSVVVVGDLISNQEYGPLPIVSNDKEEGLIAIGRMYTYLNDYKESGQAKESGILFEIGFKILKKEMTAIEFTDERLPGNVGGTALFDWDGERITDYVVRTPQEINLLPTPTLEPTLEPTPEATLEPTLEPDEESMLLVPKLNNYTREANVEAEIKDLLEAFNKAKVEDGIKKLVLNVKAVEAAEAYVIELPTDLLSNNNLVHKILITTEFGNVEIPSNFFSQITTPDKITKSSTISISIKTSNLEGVDKDLKNKIGERPVVEINILVEGEIIEWNSPSIPLKVSIPYIAIEEPEDYEYIVVWHIEKDTNKIIPVTSGKYHAAPLNAVEFMTNNFGKFAVAYNHKTFNDISSYSWAKKQIEVLASKGIINGTSEITFTPGEDIKRADFIILLIKSLGLYSEAVSNFDDVLPGSYYYEYVGIAKELGITSGVGDNMFKPLEKVTRQDMMVLTANALKIAGKISDKGIESDIAKFDDKDKIASYAVEGVSTLVKKGIVLGSGNNINPLGNATRAELAAIIYKIYYM
ncbi:MAG TPA: cellulosome anchor protein [Clostridium sp.]|jgi:hypothetical protein|nr:cellulosome anchor protein [Clostridium sp.]